MVTAISWSDRAAWWRVMAADCATARSTRPAPHHPTGPIAPTAQANESFLAKNSCTSKIHRKKAQGRLMPRRPARANARKSAVRARVDHVFSEQNERKNLVVRAIGLVCAELKTATGQSRLQHQANASARRESRAKIVPKIEKTDSRVQAAESGFFDVFRIEASPIHRQGTFKKRRIEVSS